MKKTYILLFVFLSLSIKAQTIDECYINASNLDTVRTTSWFNLENEDTYLLSFRITRINSEFTLDLKYHFGADQRFTVLKGDSVWIKFPGLTVTLFSLDSVYSKKGGGDIRGQHERADYPGCDREVQN